MNWLKDVKWGKFYGFRKAHTGSCLTQCNPCLTGNGKTKGEIFISIGSARTMGSPVLIIQTAIIGHFDSSFKIETKMIDFTIFVQKEKT